VSVLRLKSWSPWIAGAGIGMLSWFSFATANKALGITTAFEHTAALAIRTVYPSNPYFFEPDRTPKIGWEWMLVVGVFLGAYVSSRLSGDRSSQVVPALWRARFGPRSGTRLAGAFAGGVILMLGARLAGGCTSGHGISGTLQLAVSSWVFLITMFAVGVAAALAIYGRRGGSHV
jgi:uncharacterized membrane protein YedE/YeeE